MKAKVKGTNEIVEVKPNGTSKTIHMSCLEFVSEDGRVFPSVCLDIINEVDWEARRYELAKEYSKIFISLQHEKGRIDCGCYAPNVVEWSVEIADALIAELQKKQ